MFIELTVILQKSVASPSNRLDTVSETTQESQTRRITAGSKFEQDKFRIHFTSNC